MSAPLTPSEEDKTVTWDMVTENCDKQKQRRFDSCINYQIKVGNIDSTLCLSQDEKTIRESFKITDYSEKFSCVWESWPESEDDLSLIQCDSSVEDLEEKEDTSDEDSQQVTILRDHLNIMRDLNFSEGARTRSPSIDFSTSDDENDSCFMTSDEETEYYSADEPDTQSLLKPSVLDVPSKYDSEFALKGCKNSTTKYQPSETQIIGLSTPPTTPTTSLSGKNANVSKFVKRRTELLENKPITPQSPRISSNRGPNSYEITIKIPSETLKELESSSKNFQLQLGKVTKELIPLEEMKKNPAYTLKNPKQNTVGNNIKHNLDFVKTLSKSKKDRYYSRLNVFELSKILDLDDYDISLTKEVEINILEIFKEYCNFRLGYQTWIRDTTKEQRRKAIDLLYSYTSTVYPEFDKFKLEVIIRRGSYSLMQSRLRRDRRSGK